MRHVLLVCLVLTLLSVAVTAADRPTIPLTMELHGQMIPYPIQPPSIDYPEYTKPCIEKQYTVTLINSDDSLLEVVTIALHEDSARPSAPSDWLGVTGSFPEVPPHDSRSLTLRLNKQGIVCSSIPTKLYGRVIFTVAQRGDTADGVLPIQFTVADTIVFPQWDTVTTQCGIPLTVATNGNLGAHGIGGANLGFPQPVPECDTNGGDLNRGNAAIYLADASPVIVRRAGVGDYIGSWSIYDGDITSPNGFKPLYPSSDRGYFSAARWEGFNTGTFCTSDSLVKLERTVWAPYGATNADSCKFMIIRTRYWPYTINQSVSNLAIGDAFDWDVPTDSGTSNNIAGTDPTRRLVYMRGFNSADPGTDCYGNSLRYGGAALINMHMKHCVSQNALYAGYNAANDSFVYPASGFVPQQLWDNMQSTGYSNDVRITDLHTVLVYKNGAANAGYTLPANDTLNIWTAIAVVRPTGGTAAQGLDSLRLEIDKAFKWYSNVSSCCGSCCCFGTRGNVNKSVSESPDLSDLSYMITNLISSPMPTWPCFDEADINGDGKIDLTDLSWLIAYLTTEPRPTLPSCP